MFYLKSKNKGNKKMEIVISILFAPFIVGLALLAAWLLLTFVGLLLGLGVNPLQANNFGKWTLNYAKNKIK